MVRRQMKAAFKRKKLEAEKAAAKETQGSRVAISKVPRPATSPIRAEPITTILAKPSKRARADGEGPSELAQRPRTSPIRVTDTASLTLAINALASLASQLSMYSDMVSKIMKEKAEVEAECSGLKDSLKEKRKARKEDDSRLRKVEESWDNEKLSGIKKDNTIRSLKEEMAEMKANAERTEERLVTRVSKLEFEMANLYVQGYDLAVTHLKYKLPDYDTSEFKWEADMVDGHLVVPRGPPTDDGGASTTEVSAGEKVVALEESNQG